MFLKPVPILSNHRINKARLTHGKSHLERYLKTKSIKKLSNFNFQWTKTLYQNNLNNTAFFFTFFKGYRCNLLSVITPKTISSWEPEKINVKFHKNCENTGKIPGDS